MTMQDTLRIADFPVRATTAGELADELLGALQAGEARTLFFANTNFIVKCRPWLDRMHDPGVIIANDGIGLELAARLVHGQRFPDNLNGTDFTPYLFDCAARPLRVFLIGGTPQALAGAEEHVRNRLGQQVVGTCDGYGGMHDPALVERINAAGAEVVLVALGNPLQEQWILAHRDRLQAGLVAGVGALFDFWAGEKPRAPVLVRRLRMEWLYRLALEPRRLARRYTVDILLFFMLCYRHRSLPGKGAQG